MEGLIVVVACAYWLAWRAFVDQAIRPAKSELIDPRKPRSTVFEQRSSTSFAMRHYAILFRP